MELTGGPAIVTGGLSGLGPSDGEQAHGQGIPTVIVDLPSPDGPARAAEIGE